ncbi:hypothetical protein JAAARDRAFT_35616 [Jaapia argillacea MUCL 33604]|uniref:DUF6593 domain-containing protein n=1 Tax=Jaapia argillacea MUCL 33604 TaxID=933084 RepID=A0A067PT43_9AGAM|nr:hypothetical protein JAAARDRAFT_35616 [Jaapia argillacea MUCL 33604]
MELTFSHESPSRTLLLNDKDEPVYRIESPHKLSHRTTTVTRYTESHNEGDASPLAQIEWHHFRSSEIEFEGKKMKLGTFLHGSGLLGRDRTFTAKDGRSYRWRIPAIGHLKLELNEEPNTPVARYHHSGFMSTRKNACLDIYPPGTHMLDEIVATFACVEKIQKDSQESEGVVEK